MTCRTIQLFFNPRAGTASSSRVRALRSAFEAADARVIVSESVNRLEVRDGVDHVCVVGGDGTLRHVAAAVRRSGRPITMSVYPAGTVNLLAMECAYSRNPTAFAERVLRASAERQHYAGQIRGQKDSGTPLLSCASVGPDSYAVANVSPWLKRMIGRGAYGVAFARLLLRWPRARLVLTHDGAVTRCEAVYVAKGRYFAGRHSLAPDAAVDQPLFHILAIDRATRLRFLALAWGLLRGRRLETLPGVSRFTCAELTLSSEDGADLTPPLQADGDIVARLPATITLHRDTMAFA